MDTLTQTSESRTFSMKMPLDLHQRLSTHAGASGKSLTDVVLESLDKTLPRYKRIDPKKERPDAA